MPARFPIGKLVATPAALRTLEENGVFYLPFVARHACGDWGQLDADDKAANDAAVTDGTRIFSAYDLPKGGRIWIITEADRSSTCVLLPDDY